MRKGRERLMKATEDMWTNEMQQVVQKATRAD